MKDSSKMFWENIETIEQVLQNYFNDKELEVKELTCEAGSKDGDNYMSLIKRVHVRYHRPDNKGQLMSLIVKRHVLNNKQRIMFNCEPAMINEINAYSKVLPILKKFTCRDDQLPFANMFFAGSDEKGEMIVLEDLTRLGYEMECRQSYLDFGHCIAVLKSLAKFHAASLAMKSMRIKEFRALVPKLKNHLYGDENLPSFRMMMESAVSESMSSLAKHSNSNGEFDDVIEMFTRVGGKRLHEVIKDELIYDKTDVWNVMCHGDLWVNNLMFLKENDTVKNCVFVDLQVFRYGHLINDILSFIYCTTNRTFRESHLDQLLSIYHDSLIDCLRRTLSNENKKFHELETEFSLDNIKTKFHSHALFGFGSSLIVIPAVTYDSLTPIIESFLSEDDHQKIMIITQPPKYHHRVCDLYKDFSKNGHFKNLA